MSAHYLYLCSWIHCFSDPGGDAGDVGPGFCFPIENTPKMDPRGVREVSTPHVGGRGGGVVPVGFLGMGLVGSRPMAGVEEGHPGVKGGSRGDP